MRQAETCPVCKSDVIHTGKRILEGELVLVYWHTDTNREQEYCIEHPGGIGEKVRLTDTGPPETKSA